MPKALPIVLAAALLLAACGNKVTPENYERIESGMTRDKVIEILGPPDDQGSVAVGELSGASAKWTGGGYVVSITFANGKVAFKSLTRKDDQG